MQEAYTRAITLFKECSTPYGFIASKDTRNSNYDRIWARDSMICSIAAMMTKDKNLIRTVKHIHLYTRLCLRFV